MMARDSGYRYNYDSDCARAENQLETVGGMDYLLSLDRVSATTAHVDHHAKLVHELAEIRRLCPACAYRRDREIAEW